jgi:hypothetical protein
MGDGTADVTCARLTAGKPPGRGGFL